MYQRSSSVSHRDYFGAYINPVQKLTAAVATAIRELPQQWVTICVLHDARNTEKSASDNLKSGDGNSTSLYVIYDNAFARRYLQTTKRVTTALEHLSS